MIEFGSRITEEFKGPRMRGGLCTDGVRRMDSSSSPCTRRRSPTNGQQLLTIAAGNVVLTFGLD